ncbi:MAG: Holliday junction resolvase RuvX [Vulcanimicrobiaceae bacterium]
MPTLALDVGSRRIGIAVSDPGERFALPLRVLERATVHEDLQAIVDLAAEHGATTIVVGDPVRLTGERGPAADKIDEFCRVLGRAFAGTIARVDERLTTAQATRSLIAADVSRKRRKQLVDGMAAALILETFLAGKRTAGR